jgi:DNA-binding CsgD family transcriptional regulator
MNSGMNQEGIVRSSVTWREHEVLSWVAEGKANKDIAQILCISPRTVQKHLETIFRKLGVENRTSAALRYVAINEKRMKKDY